MKKLLTLLMSALVLAGVILPGAKAGPSPGGVSSDNVEWLKHVPFEVGTATGSRLIGKYLYVTSWKNFSIYDVSDPENPNLLSITPFAADGSTSEGFRFENEDVETNGKILIFSEETPRDQLYIYNVEDKTNPTFLSLTPDAGGHTVTCIFKCKYLYGSTGNIVDIRDPLKPKVVGNWQKEVGLQGGSHDLTEVKPGFLLTAPLSGPIQYLDARDPLHPKVLAQGMKPENTPIIHSVAWPRGGKDRWMLVQAEKNFTPRCNEGGGGFMVFDTKGWQKSHTFKFVDQFKAVNGTFADGNPPANGLGCSAHWFEVRDDWKDGGLVADGFYEHGSKFFTVDHNTGKIKEVGYMEPIAGSTSADHWINHDIVYAIDYTRGIDILRYLDK